MNQKFGVVFSNKTAPLKIDSRHDLLRIHFPSRSVALKEIFTFSGRHHLCSALESHAQFITRDNSAAYSDKYQRKLRFYLRLLNGKMPDKK